MQGAAAATCTEETCQNIATIQKLKGEIKRLRQELILKGPSKRKQHRDQADYDSEDDSQNEGILDEEERAALRLLSPDQRKIFAELEQAGANPSYLKRKLKQALLQ